MRSIDNPNGGGNKFTISLSCPNLRKEPTHTPLKLIVRWTVKEEAKCVWQTSIMACDGNISRGSGQISFSDRFSCWLCLFIIAQGGRHRDGGRIIHVIEMGNVSGGRSLPIFHINMYVLCKYKWVCVKWMWFDVTLIRGLINSASPTQFIIDLLTCLFCRRTIYMAWVQHKRGCVATDVRIHHRLICLFPLTAACHDQCATANWKRRIARFWQRDLIRTPTIPTPAKEKKEEKE